MATKQIVVDDITSQEINGSPIPASIGISIPAEGLSEEIITLLKEANFGLVTPTKDEAAKGLAPHYMFNANLDLAYQSLGILTQLFGGNITGVYEAIRPMIKENRTPQNNESDVIRAWAAKNGMPVNNRGRVPAEIVAKYRAATQELSTDKTVLRRITSVT